jgi:hypothetical protein
MSQILTSLHGRLAGLDANGRLVVPAGFIAGGHGKQIEFPSPSRAALFDDFTKSGQAYSTTAVDGWLSRKGTTNAVDFTVTEAVNGTVVGKVGDTTASMAVSGVQLSAGLNWKANQGGLCFEARVKTGIITNIAIFVGFTDQVSALEMPIQSAASVDTITTNATDAVGFMFDTSMSTKNWWLVGVANDVDATAQNSTYAPVADTYETLRIEVTTGGVANFYRNGVQVGSAMTGALTATIALTPVIAAFNRTTTNGATTIVTADYINVSADRA